MSSAIHYRMKAGSQLGDWHTIHFDGYSYTAFELKQRIIYAEHLLQSASEAGSFDLLLTNSQNGDEYRDDIFQIHRNSSVLVKKIPAANPVAAAKLWIPPGSLGPDWNKSTSTWTPEGGPNSNLAVMATRTGGEDDGMAAAMATAGKYASAPRGRSGPFNPVHQRGALTAQSRPPSGYVCHRCKQNGHYIQFCPTNGDSNYDLGRRGATTREDREKERLSERDRERERYSGGGGGSRDWNPATSSNPHLAPISEKVSVWLKPVEDRTGGSDGHTDSASTTAAPIKGPSKYIFESGFFSSTTTGQGQIAHVAPPSTQPAVAPTPSQLQYQLSDPSNYDGLTASGAAAAGLKPDTGKRADLMCTLCHDYFLSAHSLGCCFTSFCQSCIRDHLATHNGVCPSCDEPNMSAGDLEANPNLQKAVDEYLAEHSQIQRNRPSEQPQQLPPPPPPPQQQQQQQPPPQQYQAPSSSLSSGVKVEQNLNAAFNSAASFPPPPPPPTMYQSAGYGYAPQYQQQPPQPNYVSQQQAAHYPHTPQAYLPPPPPPTHNQHQPYPQQYPPMATQGQYQDPPKRSAAEEPEDREAKRLRFTYPHDQQ